MISFPGGSGYNLKTLSQSCFNQGSTTASGLERKTLHEQRMDKWTNNKWIKETSKWMDRETDCRMDEWKNEGTKKQTNV